MSGAQWPPKPLPTDPPWFPWKDIAETDPGSGDDQALYAIWYALQQLYKKIAGGGGIGGCCPINIVDEDADTIAVTADMFDGKTVLSCNLPGGTVSAQLPDPTTVTPGKVLRFTMVGDGANFPALELIPFASETLDKQSLGTGEIVTQPTYSTVAGQFIPAQMFGLYSDGTNYRSATNF